MSLPRSACQSGKSVLGICDARGRIKLRVTNRLFGFVAIRFVCRNLELRQIIASWLKQRLNFVKCSTYLYDVDVERIPNAV